MASGQICVPPKRCSLASKQPPRHSLFGTYRSLLNVILLFILPDLGILQVASSVIKTSSGTVSSSTKSTLSTSLNTTTVSTPAALPTLATIANHTTITSSANFTAVPANIRSTASRAKASVSTSTLAIIETSAAKPRADSLTPNFFYDGPLEVRCKPKTWVLQHMFIPVTTGATTVDPNQFGISAENLATALILPRKRYNEVFSKDSEDWSVFGYIQTNQKDTAVLPGEQRLCSSRYIAARCEFLYGCSCTAVLRNPTLQDINFPVHRHDFQHAINGIPNAVILDDRNQEWTWTVPPEIADDEVMVLRPGDPAEPRTNIANLGEPPFWLYGPRRNPPELQLGQTADVGNDNTGPFRDPFNINPNAFRTDPEQIGNFINYGMYSNFNVDPHRRRRRPPGGGAA
ncbi:uncharacterized protein DFL_008414 [Arthrobotrys flagrans]|uniref:Uncharacterized protein n=1 Tax=Arthrobotrys flagrans TaxID=97331 RepID=A0A436ZNP2_ARTFL|nr:hypothetical protein DFL_008414 [Arthrobotrys flagrans]